MPFHSEKSLQRLGQNSRNRPKMPHVKNVIERIFPNFLQDKPTFPCVLVNKIFVAVALIFVEASLR